MREQTLFPFLLSRLAPNDTILDTTLSRYNNAKPSNHYLLYVSIKKVEWVRLHRIFLITRNRVNILEIEREGHSIT